MVAMVMTGLATMVYTVYTIFNDDDNEPTLWLGLEERS